MERKNQELSQKLMDAQIRFSNAKKSYFSSLTMYFPFVAELVTEDQSMTEEDLYHLNGIMTEFDSKIRLVGEDLSNVDDPINIMENYCSYALGKLTDHEINFEEKFKNYVGWQNYFACKNEFEEAQNKLRDLIYKANPPPMAAGSHAGFKTQPISITPYGFMLGVALVLALGSVVTLAALYIPDHMPTVISHIVESLSSLQHDLILGFAYGVGGLAAAAIVVDSAVIHKTRAYNSSAFFQSSDDELSDSSFVLYDSENSLYGTSLSYVTDNTLAARIESWDSSDDGKSDDDFFSKNKF